jgi:hypothetical protein
VHSAAMIYMFLAIKAPAAGGGSGMSGMGGVSGMSTLSVPTLGFGFALILIGYTIWDLDQLSSLRYSLASAIAGAATPALAGAGAGTVGAETMAESGAGGGLAADPSAGSGRAGRDSSTGGGRSGVTSILDSPGTVVGCRIAMGVTMALMLIVMV